MVSIQILCTCCNASTFQKGNVVMTNGLLHEWTVEMWRNAAESLLVFLIIFPAWTTDDSYLPETSIHTETHTYIYIYALCIYIMLKYRYLSSLYSMLWELCRMIHWTFVPWEFAFTKLDICALGLHLVNICAVDIWKVTLHLYSNSLTVYSKTSEQRTLWGRTSCPL